MDQLEIMKQSVEHVKVLQDQYEPMDVAEHASTHLSDVKTISIGVHQEILDILLECETSFAFRMSGARNNVVMEHENLVAACTELQEYLNQPTRTQVSLAFSTMGALKIIPEPMANMVNIVEKIVNQIINLTSGEPNFEEVLATILETLPNSWLAYTQLLPPKLVHALLTYPDETSKEAILDELRSIAPPELKRCRQTTLLSASALKQLSDTAGTGT